MGLRINVLKSVSDIILQMRIYILLVFVLFLYSTSNCLAQDINLLPESITSFAVIGDYGGDTDGELSVSNLVKSWNPDFVITVGDNNYETGEADTIDKNIGKYYQEYIGNYMGSFGPGATENKFFPSLGNHDWYSMTGATPYLDYFTLPGNERYFDFVKGPVHFFVLDSDPNEPDGITSTSKQAEWLMSGLAASTSKFKIVYFHHPPFSSGEHGNTVELDWPFKEWGADIALCGHEHDYERLIVDGFPFLIVGTGGKSLREFKTILSTSKFRYSDNYGALLVKASDSNLILSFYSVKKGGTLIDQYSIRKKDVSSTSSTLKESLNESLSSIYDAQFVLSQNSKQSIPYTKKIKKALSGFDLFIAKSKSDSCDLEFKNLTLKLSAAINSLENKKCIQKKVSCIDSAILDRFLPSLKQSLGQIQDSLGLDLNTNSILDICEL